MIIQALRFFRSNKRNASLEQQFRTFGPAVQAQVYNTTKIHTIVPQNLQSVFSTDFDSWGIAPLRLFFFGPFIGKGIMTTDDLSAYAVHVNRLLAALSKHDGSDFDLKPYFERLALDSSTEFLFGHSTGSLTASPTLDAQAFLQAYNYGQAGIGKRMQVPQWNVLTRDKRFWSSCKLARAFVERCVAQASASGGNAATKEPSRLILAHQLAAQTSHHNDIVNQLLNVFLPAHDATAVALTNVFFHLSRHPIAYTRLRQAILDLGPYSTWTFERLKACKYLQAVLNETFRLNPSIGQMNRVALRDTVLPAGGGIEGKSPVFVKKGTMLTTSLYALHRSPQIWGQDSDTWRPERWLQKGRDELVKVGHWTFLPFGGGPRICIGMQLALTEVAYAVGRLAQRYQRVDCRDPV
ncbi:hypothetical protein XPA_006128 [Xanthoria parietina]